MIVYEVELNMDPALLDDYCAWLDAHVRQMLALPGFVDARLCEPIDPAPPSATARLCVQYRLRDAQALDDYLRDHAPRMRTEGLARYGERVSAQRRVWRVLADYAG